MGEIMESLEINTSLARSILTGFIRSETRASRIQQGCARPIRRH